MSETTSQMAEANNDKFITDLGDFVKDQALINNLPASVRQKLIAEKVIGHVDIYQEALADIESVAVRHREFYLEADTEFLGRMFKSIFTAIDGLVAHWQQDSAAMECALNLSSKFLGLVVCKDWCQGCVCWKNWIWAKKSETEDCLTRILARHCHTIMGRILEELEKPSPQWNSEWFSWTTTIFAHMMEPDIYEPVLRRKQRPRQTARQTKRDILRRSGRRCISFRATFDDIPHPRALEFASHIYAYIQIFWGADLMLASRNLPAELRRMTLDEVLAQKKIRHLPSPDFQWDTDLSTKDCKTCSLNCPLLKGSVLPMLKSTTHWEYSPTHVSNEFSSVSHSADCPCDVLVRDMLEVYFLKIACDPASILAENHFPVYY